MSRRNLISIGDSSRMKMWDMKTGDLLYKIEMGGQVRSMDNDATRLVTFLSTGVIKVWDFLNVESEHKEANPKSLEKP